jgi:hypothetical protein
MGIIILVAPAEVPPGVVILAILWTIIGGGVLIYDGLLLRTYYLANRGAEV